MSKKEKAVGIDCLMNQFLRFIKEQMPGEPVSGERQNAARLRLSKCGVRFERTGMLRGKRI